MSTEDNGGVAKSASPMDLVSMRIAYLLSMSKTALPTSTQLAHQYLYDAFMLASSSDKPLPPDLVKYTCKKCYNLLMPGFNTMPTLISRRTLKREKTERDKSNTVSADGTGAIISALNTKRLSSTHVQLNHISMRCAACGNNNKIDGTRQSDRIKSKKKRVTKSQSKHTGHGETDKSSKMKSCDAAPVDANEEGKKRKDRHHHSFTGLVSAELSAGGSRAAPVNAAVGKGLDIVVGAKRPFSFTSNGEGSSSTAAPAKLSVLEKMELEKKRKRQKVGGEKDSGGGVVSASGGLGGRTASSTGTMAPKPSALSSFFTTLQGGSK